MKAMLDPRMVAPSIHGLDSARQPVETGADRIIASSQGGLI
jgi:hypothetical protein